MCVYAIMYMYVLGCTHFLQTGELGKCECRYVTSALDAEYVYTQLYRQYTTSPHYLIKTPFLSSQIGSPQLRKVSVTIILKAHIV